MIYNAHEVSEWDWNKSSAFALTVRFTSALHGVVDSFAESSMVCLYVDLAFVVYETYGRGIE